MSMCAAALGMSDSDRAELGRVASSSASTVRAARQARVLLLAADGVANEAIARREQVAPNTVRAWRAGFEAGGLAWVDTVAPGRGPERSVSAETEAAIVADTLTVEPPGGAVCWTTREMAARHGVGKDIVARTWREAGLRPWRTDIFKVSGDPDFEAKLDDVIGLYLDPPERAVVFSFDDKTQIQALDRTQPSLPLKAGRARTLTHDCKRNGTIDLFAALNVATGQVLTQTRRRHTGDDVLAFLKETDRRTPRHLDIHVVLDNLSAHKSDPVRKWLAEPRQRRWHLHFTPTSSSWANLVEGWFSIPARKALKGRAFTSVAHLVEVIETWAANWNDDPRPLRWTKTAEQINAKIQRARTALNRATQPATHHWPAGQKRSEALTLSAPVSPSIRTLRDICVVCGVLSQSSPATSDGP
ncbi:MAG: IS630 family transposase [Acidimicrobiaceae bacterium]|nr:IS630 family transposase [Acidimicrobiaceae bacterium]